MGLAASQARFLGITARKNSCELKSMQIAQEKLSITNQLTQASIEYQNSLDATKLVWDSEAIIDGSIYDVSYELLMQPSLLNDYSPQILTNNKNQVVLNSQMANALREMGIIQNGKQLFNADGSPQLDESGNAVYEKLGMENFKIGGAERTTTNFKKFLGAMTKQGVLSSYNYDKIIKALDTNSKLYKENMSLGADAPNKFLTDSMNLATMKNYINTITDPNSSYLNDLRETWGTAYDASGNLPSGATPTIYDEVKRLASILNFELGYSITTKNGETINNVDFGTYVKNQGGYTSDTPRYNKDNDLTISDSKFNFAELLNKDITLSTKGAWDIGDMLIQFINQLYKIMSEFLAINPDSVDQNYLNFAMTQVCALANLQWNANSSTAEGSISSGYSTGDPAHKHTGIIKNGDYYQVSLSNLAKGALTYFEVAVEGFNSGYKVESNGSEHIDNSYYITSDPNYMYFIDNPEYLDEDNETLLLIDYYSQLFNQICANGWTESAMVDDNENLKNMLKNGTLFTSTLADDGMFYQGAYTSNNFIAEVADEDAIVRAEAEFKTKQAKLTAKEEELNIDMQMVDAELSALTTEYDTVKQMISKGVEKGFSTLGG